MKTTYWQHWDKESIWIIQECTCEHCGELEPFDPVFCDTRTTWCLDCAQTNGKIEQEDIKRATEKSLWQKMQYFLKRYNECMDGLAKLRGGRRE